MLTFKMIDLMLGLTNNVLEKIKNIKLKKFFLRTYYEKSDLINSVWHFKSV